MTDEDKRWKQPRRYDNEYTWLGRLVMKTAAGLVLALSLLYLILLGMNGPRAVHDVDGSTDWGSVVCVCLSPFTFVGALLAYLWILRREDELAESPPPSEEL